MLPDAVSGQQRWKFHAHSTIIGGVTPTACGVLFFGDMGGNFYALNSENGRKLWEHDLGGAASGGVITYDTGNGQKVAVSGGMTSKIWPTPKTTARIYVLAAE